MDGARANERIKAEGGGDISRGEGFCGEVFKEGLSSLSYMLTLPTPLSSPFGSPKTHHLAI